MSADHAPFRSNLTRGPLEDAETDGTAHSPLAPTSAPDRL